MIYSKTTFAYPYKMPYMDMWEIVENAHKGSGYTRSKPTTRAKTVLDSLAQKGWSKTYLKTALQKLDDSLLAGWPDELFQEYYMKHSATVQNTLDTSLVKLGLTPRKVREVLHVIAPLYNTCYTQKQLLDVALEYALGKYKPITPPDASYFLQPDITNSWISYKKKELLNATYSCRYTAIPRFKELIDSTFSKADGKVFFHTTNWDSAVKIMNVIQAEKGRPCLDFGYKPCFYVSESAEDAIDWGVKKERKWEGEVAIMVFCLPQNFEREFDYKNLTNEEWKWAVTSFRDCGDIPEVAEYDDAHDFIYGPMLANSEFYASEGARLHRPPVMQLAAKTRNATRYLYSHMKGAIVFRKSYKPA